MSSPAAESVGWREPSVIRPPATCSDAPGIGEVIRGRDALTRRREATFGLLTDALTAHIAVDTGAATVATVAALHDLADRARSLAADLAGEPPHHDRSTSP